MHVRLGTEFSNLNLCWQEEHNIWFVVIFIFVFPCFILVVEPNKILENIVYFSKMYGRKVRSFNMWHFFSVGCLVRVGKHQ